MGKGREEVPFELATLRGDAKASRLSQRRLGGEPVKPSWISRGGAKAWHDVMAMDGVKSYLCEADSYILAMYCETVAGLRAIQERIKKDGGEWESIVLESMAGTPMVSPLLKPLKELTTQLKSLASELGFTPSSRRKVEAPPPKTAQGDEFAAFMKGAREVEGDGE